MTRPLAGLAAPLAHGTTGALDELIMLVLAVTIVYVAMRLGRARPRDEEPDDEPEGEREDEGTTSPAERR